MVGDIIFWQGYEPILFVKTRRKEGLPPVVMIDLETFLEGVITGSRRGK